MPDRAAPPADALVMFGATGDLAKRKLFPALYQMESRGELSVPVIGVSRSDWDDDAFRSHVHEAVLATYADAKPSVLDELCAKCYLIGGDYADIATFRALVARLDDLGSKLALYYLAVPPSVFSVVIESLAAVGESEHGRICVEKPFGRDLESAKALNAVIHQHLEEDQVFRIDHYLGKESVEDLVVFRFANTFLEPIWNRNYVSSVQITMAESIDVEGRGAFYDSVGAIRDVVQNHLLQVVALLAMEPPVGPQAKHMSDEKMKVFAAMRSLEPANLVRGQYEGYRDEPGVDPGSERRDVRGAPPRDRLVALGRGAVLRTGGQGHGDLGDRGGGRVASSAGTALRRVGTSRSGAQPDPLPSGQERRGDVRGERQDAGTGARFGADRVERRLRRGAERAARGLRAADLRCARGKPASVRALRHRRGDLEDRRTGARRSPPAGQLRARLVGTGRG